MRRERGKREKKGDINFRYILYLSSGVLFILAVTFIVTFISYNNKLKSSADQFVGFENMAGIVPNNTNDILNTLDFNIASAPASVSIGNTINNEAGKSAANTVNTSGAAASVNKDADTNTTKKEESKAAVQTNAPAVPAPVPDPTFVKPVDGDITKEFAENNLVFSDTLQEWVTHPGVDIGADRTMVVKAAADGTVSSIKSDPRYGLTIIIDHVNGYQTVYANLLSSEFVKEGDKVSGGQSIGTVGNSAAFEIVDSPHLHFEILKDNVPLDPSIYIK